MNALRRRRALFLSTAVAAAVLSGAGSALLGICGPFTDVTDAQFCPFVLEIFTLGITTGTTPTTYDPTSAVSRLQMAAFLSRTVDGVLRRGSRRAAMKHFWTSQNESVLGLTTVGNQPYFCAADGAEIWVSNTGGPYSVSRVRANDGKLLETWTGFTDGFPSDVLVAMGRVLVTGSPKNLYAIDPSQPAGAATVVASVGTSPQSLAFDGARVWTGNFGAGFGDGSVSIVTPGSLPWTATTITTGFFNPLGILYDGASVWTADYSEGRILKLNGSGAVVQTVFVGSGPNYPVFDGANIWVPNYISNSVTVVRASNGAVLQTLTGNGLNLPRQAAFDGERVLVTNNSGDAVSVWKAADLTSIGFFPTGSSTTPHGACSDGNNFWIALSAADKLARF